jgi:hypothetical protein
LITSSEIQHKISQAPLKVATIYKKECKLIYAMVSKLEDGELPEKITVSYNDSLGNPAQTEILIKKSNSVLGTQSNYLIHKLAAR